ncbi:MAG: hypothetical protein Q9M92_03810 [Enterobacterales bacterium]|nr:hypothetical protein [Enterobacterales bacterium]
MKLIIYLAQALSKGFIMLLLLTHVFVKVYASQQKAERKMQPSTSSLSELVDRTLSHGSFSNGTVLPDFESSEWLAASPSIRLNLLKSQQSFGSDELEIGMNLAIKSTSQRRIDKQLLSLKKAMIDQLLASKRLYFSGILREILWSYRMASKKQDYLTNKILVLNKLQKHRQYLADAGESSRYGLLVVAKEIIATQIALMDNQSNQLLRRERFAQLTGLNKLPNDIKEPLFDKTTKSGWQHPELKLIQLKQQQDELMLKEQSSDASPWNFSVSAKNVESLGVSHKQLGLSIEMPFSLVAANQQSLVNQQSQNRQLSDTEFHKKRLEIKQTLLRLKRNKQYLLKKRTLLEKSVAISQQIMTQIERLKSQNELGQELALRRVLEAMQSRYDYQLTKLFIEQNNSLTLQAAGISL